MLDLARAAPFYLLYWYKSTGTKVPFADAEDLKNSLLLDLTKTASISLALLVQKYWHRSTIADVKDLKNSLLLDLTKTDLVEDLKIDKLGVLNFTCFTGTKVLILTQNPSRT